MKKLIFLLILFPAVSYAGNQQIGPLYPSTCVNTPIGIAMDWLSPGNATIDDGIVATSTNATSNICKCTGYNFFVPMSAKINGIFIEFKKSANASNNVVDNSVRIYNSGTAVGTDKADGSTIWPAGVLTYVGYGGSTDLWGVSWTAKDINDPNFGSGISGLKNSAGPQQFKLDVERITVYYYVPTTINNGTLYNDTLR
jgi:hypothetical protein